jgi:hypothetical protein
MYDGYCPDYQLYLSGPPAVPEGQIINKNKNVVIRRKPDRVIYRIGNIKQVMNCPAGHPPETVVENFHQYGDEDKKNQGEEYSALKSIGVVFMDIVGEYKHEKEERTKVSV